MSKLSPKQIAYNEAEQQAKKETKAVYRKAKRITVKIAGTKGTGCQYLPTEREAAEYHANSIGGIVVDDYYKPTLSQSSASQTDGYNLPKITTKDVLDREDSEDQLIAFNEDGTEKTTRGGFGV